MATARPNGVTLVLSDAEARHVAALLGLQSTSGIECMIESYGEAHPGLSVDANGTVYHALSDALAGNA